MLKIFLRSLFFAAALASPYAASGEAAVAAGYAAQINNARGIKVTVILENSALAAKDLEFRLILETHTQPLSDDLARSAVLIADGKQYQPLGWEGAPPGGHHRKGRLRFKAVIPQPRALELQLRLTGETSPRSFQWLLK